MYHQLTNLIRDTVWLKSYLSAGALGRCMGWLGAGARAGIVQACEQQRRGSGLVLKS